MQTATCTGCGGRAGEGSQLDETPTGQAWVCASCVLDRRRSQLRAGLALLELEQGAAWDAALDDSEAVEARAHALGIGEGIAIAAKHLVGADLPMAPDFAPPSMLPEQRIDEIEVVRAVPRIRLRVTGALMAFAVVTGCGGLMTQQRSDGVTPTVTARRRATVTARRTPAAGHRSATVPVRRHGRHARAARPVMITAGSVPGVLAA